jgi:hypothetical protein
MLRLCLSSLLLLAPLLAQPIDESRRLAVANRTKAEVVPKALLGKAFMPGGTLATYKKGAKEYRVFVTKLKDPTTAAILLLDWKKALQGAKLIPSFGGYFGTDGGQPVFVFTKGPWMAGTVGLTEKEADAEARVLATRLN